MGAGLHKGREIRLRAAGCHGIEGGESRYSVYIAEKGGGWYAISYPSIPFPGEGPDDALHAIARLRCQAKHNFLVVVARHI